jgi:hypothetical protein
LLAAVRAVEAPETAATCVSVGKPVEQLNGINMRLLTLTTAIALALASAPAMGKTGHPPKCPPGQSQCQPQKAKPGKGHKAAQDHPAPRLGQTARNARPFQEARKSRLKTLPRGQEYRVVNDHIVRVDSKTLQILAVVGLLSALSN